MSFLGEFVGVLNTSHVTQRKKPRAISVFLCLLFA